MKRFFVPLLVALMAAAALSGCSKTGPDGTDCCSLNPAGPTPAGQAPTVVTNAATNITQNAATPNCAVNPNGSTTTAWFEWGTSQSLGNSTPTQNAGSGTGAVNIASNLTALASDTLYYFRCVGQNTAGAVNGETLSFRTGTGTQLQAPTVTTQPATSIGTGSANLNCSVNPNGSATTAQFEYGTTQSLGQTTSSQDMGNGTASVNLSQTVPALGANTLYYFRCRGQNQAGTTFGNVLSFTTGNIVVQPPTVTTQPATNVTSSSATLNGSVNPNGSATTAWFEYGTSPSLGTMVGTQSVGSGNSLSNISFNLTALASNTLYYYRAVAQNSGGTTFGNVLSFTTATVQQPQLDITWTVCESSGQCVGTPMNLASYTVHAKTDIKVQGQVTYSNLTCSHVQVAISSNAVDPHFPVNNGGGVVTRSPVNWFYGFHSADSSGSGFSVGIQVSCVDSTPVVLAEKSIGLTLIR